MFIGFWIAQTMIDTFGLSFPILMSTKFFSSNCSFFKTSRHTRGAKVADIATNGVPFGRIARRIPSSMYCFQKPAPQWETTWASSTTIERILEAMAGLCKTSLMNGLERMISREIRTICHSPLQIFCISTVSFCFTAIGKYLQSLFLMYSPHECYSPPSPSIQTHFEKSMDFKSLKRNSRTNNRQRTRR